MPIQDTVLLMSAERINRTIRRFAYQIIEDREPGEQICIIGVDHRGFILGRLLADALSTIITDSPECLYLPVKNQSVPLPEVSKTNGTFCIIIDDVIFSGSTMFNAFKTLLDTASPKRIKVAALVDRGHRLYPLEAHYTGIVSPTKLDEHVRCEFNDNGKPESVLLEHTG